MLNMNYSKNAMTLIKDFEGCRLTAYRDGGGVLTQGYGNTHHVIEGSTITQERADADLLANVQDAVDAVNDYVTMPLHQGQFDALVDFTFNVGVNAFKKSTLLRLLNTGDYQGAHDQFDRWNMDNGKVVKGLQRRRDADQKLWSTEPERVAEAVVEAIEAVPAKAPPTIFTIIMGIITAIMGAFKK